LGAWSWNSGYGSLILKLGPLKLGLESLVRELDLGSSISGARPWELNHGARPWELDLEARPWKLDLEYGIDV